MQNFCAKHELAASLGAALSSLLTSLLLMLLTLLRKIQFKLKHRVAKKKSLVHQQKHVSSSGDVYYIFFIFCFGFLLYKQTQ